MTEQNPTPDGPLTPEQEELVENLSQATIREIDEALLNHTGHRWRKVARVVGSTMMDLHNRPAGIPDVYYAQRVRRLVETGLLESQGDLSEMGDSEVRRVGSQVEAAQT